MLQFCAFNLLYISLSLEKEVKLNLPTQWLPLELCIWAKIIFVRKLSPTYFYHICQIKRPKKIQNKARIGHDQDLKWA